MRDNVCFVVQHKSWIVVVFALIHYECCISEFIKFYGLRSLKGK